MRSVKHNRYTTPHLSNTPYKEKGESRSQSSLISPLSQTKALLESALLCFSLFETDGHEREYTSVGTKSLFTSALEPSALFSAEMFRYPSQLN